MNLFNSPFLPLCKKSPISNSTPCTLAKYIMTDVLSVGNQEMSCMPTNYSPYMHKQHSQHRLHKRKTVKIIIYFKLENCQTNIKIKSVLECDDAKIFP